MQKTKLYRSLRDKNLTTKLKSHLIRHYEFAKKSRLGEALIELVLDELDRDEATRGVVRVQPWQLVFRRHEQVALLPLLTEEDVEQLNANTPLGAVRETIEARGLSELRTVWPEATLTDLRSLTNVRYRTRKGAGAGRGTRPTLKAIGPGDRLAPLPKVIDLERFAKDVSRRQPRPEDGLVSAPALARLCQQLAEDYNLPPKLAPLIVQDFASLRAECLPRLDELKHGQVMVLTTDTRSGIGGAAVPEEQRLRPVVLTLFTDPEQRALQSERITFPRARLLQLKQLVRVHVEAYAQGGLLSRVETQCLFLTSRDDLSEALNAYEQTHQVIVPTPGTILDAGNKVTHKLLVVRLYLEGLSTTEIAKRTYHSEQAVDTYIGTFDQVTALYWYRVPRSIMRLVLRRSLRLIDEYLRLVDRYFKDPEAVRAYLDGKGIKVA